MSSATWPASGCSSSVPERWAKVSPSPSTAPVVPTSSCRNRSADARSSLAERVGRCRRRVRTARRGDRRGRCDRRQHRRRPSRSSRVDSSRRPARDLVRRVRCTSSTSPCPRDVEAGVADLPGVTVLDLDDLRDWADRGLVASRRRGRTRPRHRVGGGRAVRASSRPPARPLRSSASMHDAADVIRVRELDRFDKRTRRPRRRRSATPSKRSPGRSSPSCCTSRRCGSRRRPAHPRASATR